MPCLDVVEGAGGAELVTADGRRGLARLTELCGQSPLLSKARGLGLAFGVEVAGDSAAAVDAAAESATAG